MIHTALLPLPGILESLGLNVVVSDGWEWGQQYKGAPYLWTDPDTGQRSFDNPPSCFVVNHTGTKTAQIPSAATSKTNAWIGLLQPDGHTLNQYGTGEPVIALTTAGPSTFSSGSGYKPAAWDYPFQNLRAPYRAEGPDSSPKVYLNRYGFAQETVAKGVGTPIDLGVWEHVVGLGVGLHMLFDYWKERTLGHASWTQRKPDPDWTVGKPNDGAKAIIDIQDQIVTDLAKGSLMYIPIKPGSDRRGDVRWMQRALNRTGASLAADGIYGDITVAAMVAFQADQGLTQNGMLTAKTYDYLLAAAYINPVDVSALEARIAKLEDEPDPNFDDRYSLLGHGHLVTGTVTGEAT